MSNEKATTENIEQLRLADLNPYQRNARTHSDEQIAKLQRSIEEFGFINPILVDEDNGIIAGHGRRIAAMRMGLDDAPCLRITHLTDSQRRAYIIADNKLAELAGWDEDLLGLELGELAGGEYDLEVMGFELDEADDLIAAAEAKDEDEFEPQEEPPEDYDPGDPRDMVGAFCVLLGDNEEVIMVGTISAGNDGAPVEEGRESHPLGEPVVVLSTATMPIELAVATEEAAITSRDVAPVEDDQCE